MCIVTAESDALVFEDPLLPLDWAQAPTIKKTKDPQISVRTIVNPCELSFSAKHYASAVEQRFLDVVETLPPVPITAETLTT